MPTLEKALRDDAVLLFVCCLSVFSKTKQFRAMVAIDDQQELIHGRFKESILGHLR